MKKNTPLLCLLFLCISLLNSICFGKQIEHKLDDSVLKLFEISQDQFKKSQDIIKKINYLDFDDLNNCENRAHWMMFELAAQNISSSTIHIEGSLINSWYYHMAIVVKVENIEMPFVFDKTFESGPMTLSKWISYAIEKDNYYTWVTTEREISVIVINHFCSIIENNQGTKEIDGIFDPDLSKRARDIFQGMEKHNRIRYYWSNPTRPKTFNCQNHGLEYQ